MRVPRPTQQEALNYLTEGWCPVCKTAIEERHGPGTTAICANGYTAAQLRAEFGLPDVVRLPRRSS